MKQAQTRILHAIDDKFVKFLQAAQEMIFNQRNSAITK